MEELTKKDIEGKLKDCLDPELGVNIVELGLIYEIKILQEGVVEILMTLTTPGCPLISYLEKEVQSKIKTLKGVKEVKINLTFDPPWTPDRMSKIAKAQLGILT